MPAAFRFRLECQHRISPHVHCVAWFRDAPNVEQLLACENDSDVISATEEITSFVNKIFNTINLSIAADGSNAEDATPSKTKPRQVCNNYTRKWQT